MVKIITIVFSIFFTCLLQGQVFWVEDFANGIPSEWSNEDLSGSGISWVYCADTLTYGGIDQTMPSCPLDYTDDCNRQVHFKSNSPENGFASFVIPAPFFGDLINNPFNTRLTTGAINCLGKSEVYLTFNTHFGVFSQNVNASLNVSTDGVNWTSYDPFPNLEGSGTTVPGFERWSLNAESINFNISDVAANQETVFLQWRWRGNDEYHWSIDDVTLTTENPTPNFDISLSPTSKFHAIMTNYQTPISQIDTAYFLTDAKNTGAEESTNVEIVALVMNASESKILYEEKIIIPQLVPNQSVTDLAFPPYYHQDGPGEYKIVYTIGNQESDGQPENSYFEYPFFISEDVFSKNKEASQIINLFPTDFNPNGMLETNWGIANTFYFPKGGGYFADEVIFEIPDRLDVNNNMYVINEVDINIVVNLFSWDNANDNNLAESAELTSIGSTNYSVTGGEGKETIRLKLFNFNGGKSRIPLEDNKHYIVALEYNASDNNKLFSVKASTGLNYEPMIEASRINNRPRYAAMAKVGNGTDYNIYTFEGNVIPHIGLTITNESGVSTTTLLDENAIEIYPNPADKKINIKLDIPIEHDAKLDILSIDGSFIRNIPLLPGNKEAIFDSTQLENGTFIIAYKSDISRLYKKIVIIH